MTLHPLLSFKNKFRDPFGEKREVNACLPNSLEIDTGRKRRKDFTSVSTTISSLDKKLLESKHKIQSMLEFRVDKYTPSSHNSLVSPDSFAYTPMDPLTGGITPMSNSKFSIRVSGKKKRKEEVSKEILAK